MNLFILFIFVGSFNLSYFVNGLWPNKKPYWDLCKGSNVQQCLAKSDLCIWKTSQYALCAEIDYSKEQPPNRDDYKTSISDRFFEFSPGIHLSEGANQQWWYNLELDDCAKKCLGAASTGAKRTRCLSFDFYPFENPKTEAPWKETVERGVCVLNSESKDQGRLRSEDQGFTDAELLYKSHFTKRPFSNLDGYYEIRDPRGGHIAKMLNYDGSADDTGNVEQDTRVTPFNIWPQTRWGLYHLYIPPPLEGNYICNGATPIDTTVIDPEDIYFRAGFTPIDLNQHCPGLMTKTAASNLCKDIGGELCSENELQRLKGKNIGCGYDDQPVWSSSSSGSDEKFARCCVTYDLLSNCEQYTPSNLNFCAGLDTLPDCVQQGSGYVRQENYGFGNLLVQMQNKCESGEGTCSGLVDDWAPRDRCVWCFEPGTINGGACFPGNDYGICPRAGDNLKKTLELKIKTYCPAAHVCNLAMKYPHIAKQFGVPTPPPTLKPTKTPTLNPTAKPSKAPITSEPTNNPTRRPTLNPTKAPTSNPIKNPTLNPTQTPTLNPTQTPSLNPTSDPTQAPSLNPTMAPSNPTENPTKNPTLNPTLNPTSTPTLSPSLNPTSSPQDSLG